MNSVYIVGGDVLVHRMFLYNGWDVVNNPDDADIIQFVGGEDVDPALYGEERHATTYSNPKRDAFESHIYRTNDGQGCAGICRGGQFLNVMVGGKMWQDVDGHCLGDTHEMVGPDGVSYQVTSTHHQMMIPNYDKNPKIWTAAESTYRETATELDVGDHDDVEVVLYKDYGVLCFQPHPEYLDVDHECQRLYFELLEEIM
jgi:gamma-glutamyl-gamma-aminobutyrate hydrolase PuuD